ncbi:MAG: low affinity iron permease family protein [Bacteroidota bacterium]|jgi:low affinity Fe/Cu permease|nr:low affinity iron permease family protein [Bacteroidota bacterium]
MAKHGENLFEKLAHKATAFSGSTIAFMMALGIILVWLLTGPLFKFSDTWQLVINTGTTIITFLMVFLIQRMQNKDSHAIHLKLNELVAALNGPSNRLIDVEDLSEDELEILGNYYQTLAKMAKKEKNLSASHSIEEAMALHKIKYSRNKHTSPG